MNMQSQTISSYARTLAVAAAATWVLFAAAGQADAALVGLWEFDNSSDVGEATVSSDLLASGAGATYTASGKIGGALSLNGTDYLRVDLSDALATGMPTGDSSYTLAAFIRTSTSADDGIIGWGSYGTNNAVNAFRTGTELGGALVNYGWGGAPDYLAPAPTMFDGEWHHVAVTYDSATSTKRLYFDGAEIGAGSVLGVDLAVTAANFRIGSTNFGEQFTGLLDDVRVYSTALSESEIRALAGPAPEPGTFVLASLGLVGLALGRRRRRLR